MRQHGVAMSSEFIVEFREETSEKKLEYACERTVAKGAQSGKPSCVGW